jgi:hypothetical protein
VIPLIPGITSSGAAMMGRQTGDQASLFYEFRLEDRIPKDHLLRRINVFLAGAHLAPAIGDLRNKICHYQTYAVGEVYGAMTAHRALPIQ